ncbi:MAG TPA: helix-turn-helix transcriptional regulator [Enterobacteriaceae bacterium]|nr:helix-turn-helix transcriptional regulator [Enterobacteriaceae bacterium]
MTQRKTKGLTIVGGCHYTASGLKSLLGSCFFHSQLITYARLDDIHDSNNVVQIIAVINECNINYSDIQWIERRLAKVGKANMLIVCHDVLQKILSCVFKIDCLYVPHNAPLCDVKEAVVRLLLERERAPHHQMNTRLTGIESRILMMLAEGLSVKEISEIRHRNIKTISSLKARLMRKMGMPNTLKALSIISIYMKSLTSSGFKSHH